MRKLGWRQPERRRLVWPYFAAAAAFLAALGAARAAYDWLYPTPFDAPTGQVVDARETEAAIRQLDANRGAPAYFMGFACKTANCAGHKAGFAWAAKYNYQSPSDCGGNSQSFREGCLAYVSK